MNTTRPPPFSTDVPPSSTTSPLYAQFHTYPFLTDASFLSGLSSILHPNSPSQEAINEEELDANPGLVLNAKLFYFSRQNGLREGVLGARGYVDWLREQTGQRQGGHGQEELHIRSTANYYGITDNTTSGTNVTTLETGAGEGHIAAQPLAQPDIQATAKQEEPPYPPSFAAIVDLITANKPIPGIEDIPDTVLEMGSSKIDHTPRRRKPWETDTTDTTDSSAMNIAGGFEPNDDDDAAAATSLDSGTRTDPVNGLGTGSGIHGSGGGGGVEVNGQTDDMTQSPWQQAGTGTRQGVAQILQPAAIPPSGLLSND